MVSFERQLPGERIPATRRDEGRSSGRRYYVVINLGNEPFGDNASVSSRWASSTSGAIRKLRGAGLQHLLMADAPMWGQDWQNIMRNNARSVLDSDPQRNTVFSTHMYGVYNTAAKINAYFDAFNPSRLTPWGQRFLNGTNGVRQTSKQAHAGIDRHHLGQALDATGLPGVSVVVTHGGEIVHAIGAGHDAHGGAVTENTPMRVASVSKSFTAAPVMMLVQDGRVGLDDEVHDRGSTLETQEGRVRPLHPGVLQCPGHSSAGLFLRRAVVAGADVSENPERTHGRSKPRAAAYFCCAVAGFVLILAVVVALAITTDWLGGGALYFVGLVAAHLICQPIGRHVVVRCWVGFKRNTSEDGWSALQADPRRPVLYLRSFLIDDLLARTGETAMDYFRTEEERLARAFARIGPLVAIGRPGEPLPPAGAPRVYVGDDWQETVRELLDRSQLVLIGAGRGEGLRWELGQVRATVDPRRVVVLLPFGNWEYDNFRSDVADLFPHPLPDLAPLPDADDHTVRAALHFREDWTAEPVRLSTDRATSLEMALLHQLAPVFAHLDDTRAPTRLQRQRDLRWLALSLAGLVLVLSAVWGLLRVFVLR